MIECLYQFFCIKFFYTIFWNKIIFGIIFKFLIYLTMITLYYIYEAENWFIFFVNAKYYLVFFT